MKKLPILLLSSLLLLGCVVGCGESTSSTPGGQTSDTNSTPAESNIKSVTLQNPGVTEVVAGTTLKLTATVDGPSGSKVTWESSDETVATVRNGTVTFKDVEEDKEVTITAFSRDDTSKKDSLTFTVKDCILDLTRSRGEIDPLLFDEEGVYVQAGETALMFEEVYGTKWYVETTLTVTDLLDSDEYPKIGLFSGTNEEGYWNGSSDTLTNKNALFYIDAMLANKGSGWNVLNFVGQNDIFTDWDWNNQYGHISLATSDMVKMENEFTMGLLRNGVNYYLYAKKGTAVMCYKHVVYDVIAADEPTYAWLGGWAVGYNAKNFKAYVGDEVDALFIAPTELKLNYSEQLMNVGSQLQLQATTDQIAFDSTKVTFESSNPSVATVDNNGCVNALSVGNTTITARLGDLTATCSILVSNVNSAFDLKTKSGEWVFLHEIDEENPYVELLPDGSSAGQDRKLLFKDVYDTKWYAQMTVETISPASEVDQYPKLGLGAVGLNSSNSISDLVWYAQDYANGSRALVMGDYTMKNGQWNFDTQNNNEYFDAPETLFTIDSKYTYGLLRDGNTYYYFRDGNLIHVLEDNNKVFVNDDETFKPSYVGLVGYGGKGAKVSNYFVKTGEEVDTMLDSLARDVKVEGTDWIKSGQVSVTDNSTFKFGANLNAGGVKSGVNKLVYDKKLNGAFEIEYDVKNFNASTAAWYWPKLAVVINNDWLCYAYRNSPNPNDSYARFETCCFGNWQNSPDFGVATFDPLATHHVKITCTAEGKINMFLDGTQIALEGSTLYERGIQYNGSNGTLEIISEFAGFEVTNFTVRDNL